MSDITFKHHDPNVMLELWHVTKRFGGLTAVGDVSFKIKKGEIYALIGPNGAGKTTIFNLITGVYALTEGRVIFDGTVVGQGDAIIKDDMRETDVKPFRKQPYDIMSRGMARTFQNIRLFKSETVYNNVLTACHAEADYNIFQSLWRLKAGPKWLTKYYYQEKALREKTEELLKIMGIWEQRDMIATAHPDVSETGRLRFDALEKLRVGDALLAVDQRRSIGEHRARFAEHPIERVSHDGPPYPQIHDCPSTASTSSS